MYKPRDIELYCLGARIFILWFSSFVACDMIDNILHAFNCISIFGVYDFFYPILMHKINLFHI